VTGDMGSKQLAVVREFEAQHLGSIGHGHNLGVTTT
jgi:hypothetical protein